MYVWRDMTVVDVDTALQLFRENTEVYMLFEDDTETLAERKGEIVNHDMEGGQLGVEKPKKIQRYI